MTTIIVATVAMIVGPREDMTRESIAADYR